MTEHIIACFGQRKNIIASTTSYSANRSASSSSRAPADLRLATLTNSSSEMLAAQMNNAGLTDYFEMLLSVDEVQRFKPAAETYRMAAEKLGVVIGDTRLVAAHDWDVFGALRAGCVGAFIARGGRPYHPLYDTPDVSGPDLNSVTDQILAIDT